MLETTSPALLRPLLQRFPPLDHRVYRAGGGPHGVEARRVDLLVKELNRAFFDAETHGWDYE